MICNLEELKIEISRLEDTLCGMENNDEVHYVSNMHGVLPYTDWDVRLTLKIKRKNKDNSK